MLNKVKTTNKKLNSAEEYWIMYLLADISVERKLYGTMITVVKYIYEKKLKKGHS